MNGVWVYAVGFAAQALFSARLLVQWIGSERLKRVVTPVLFWELSVAASLLMFLYGWLRDDFAIMLGQSITYAVYLRNLHLQGRWRRLPIWFRLFLLLFPAAAVWYGFNNGEADTVRFFYNEAIPFWLLLWGSAAQVIFTLRFVYQWFRSEQRGRSHLPLGFWILSLTGSSMILIYALLREDPVLFVGQIFGFVAYVRNILFALRSEKKENG